MGAQFGHRSSGRTPGTKNVVSTRLKEVLLKVMTPEQEASEWKAYLNHPDKGIRWEAFKLYLAYQHGKPVQPIGPAPEAEPIRLQVEHIGAASDFFAAQAKALGLK